MSEEYGTAIIRRVDNGNGTNWVELLRADDRIAVSRELLANHDQRHMQVDGDRLSLCGQAFYIATGETSPHGDPIYRRIHNEGDL